jgi:hypothetical protein
VEHRDVIDRSCSMPTSVTADAFADRKTRPSFLLDLPHAVLKDGDGLVLEDGAIVLVAANEALIEVGGEPARAGAARVAHRQSAHRRADRRR